MAKKIESTTTPTASNGVFSWGDQLPVTADRTGKLLAEGPASFKVVTFVRGRFAGSEKMPACPRADLGLEVTDREGSTAIVPVGLPLHEKMMWKLVQFAKSTGLIDADLGEGEAFTMPWDDVLGSTGVCEVDARTWVGDDGKERVSNNVVRFIYGDEALAAAED